MARRIVQPVRPSRSAPADVFYVVQSSGTVGKRDHRVVSLLYETRPQADAELARIRSEKKSGVLSVWTRTTHIEPPQWLSDVVMADGTVIRAST